MGKPEHLVTTAETAEILGKSIATVNRMAQAGVLSPAMQYPGLRGPRLFHRDDVEALLAKAGRVAS